MKNKVLLLLASVSLITASESIQINGKVQYEGKTPKPKKLTRFQKMKNVRYVHNL